MTDYDRTPVADLIPDWVEGRLSEEDAHRVEAYLAENQGAGTEVEIVRAISASRAIPPRGLDDRIKAAIREERVSSKPWLAVRRHRRVMWQLSAAAALVIALGTGIFWQNEALDLLSSPDIVQLDPMGEVWMTEDEMVAGAPVFEALSDETLTLLIAELEGS